MNITKQCAIPFLLLSLISLFACSAGRDFVKPDRDSIVIGKTTYNEIIERFGKPYQEGTGKFGDLPVVTIHYVYSSTSGALYEGVTPARSIVFHFSNNLLIGHQYSSSFKNDNTDFDETPIATIKEKITTKDEVLQRMGEPHGIIRVTENGKPTVTFNYFYTHVRDNALNMTQYQKNAIITFDENNIVSHVNLNTVGKK